MKKLIALLLIMVMVIAATPLAKPSPRLPRLRR